MRPEVFWIRAPLMGRLAIMPRPRAGEWLDDEIIGWQTEGIDTVVSLLELAEISELGLEREAELSQESGIEFISFPIPGTGDCLRHCPTQQRLRKRWHFRSAKGRPSRFIAELG